MSKKQRRVRSHIWQPQRALIRLFFVLLCGSAQPLQAQPVAVEPRLESPAARQALADAQAAVRRGQIEQADQHIERAYLSEPHPELIVYLAQLLDVATARPEQRLRAVDLLRLYLKLGQPSDDVRRRLQQRIDQALPQSAELIVVGADQRMLCIDRRWVGLLQSDFTHVTTPGEHEIALGGPRCDRPTLQVKIQTQLDVPLIVEDFFPGREPTAGSAQPVLLTLDDSPVLPTTPLAGLLTRTLLRSHRQPISAPRVLAALRGQRTRCLADLPCALDVARTLGARLWFRLLSSPGPEPGPEPGPGEQLRIEVIQVAAGVACTAGRLTLCAQCAKEAELRHAEATLRQALASADSCATAQVQLRSVPPGAQIFIDGAESAQAQTPALLTVLGGPRRVLLRRSGYLPLRAELDVPASSVQMPPPFVLQLNPAARTAQRLRVAAWLSGTLGVLALAGGITAWVLDQQITRPVADLPQDAEVLRTWPSGIAGLAGGALLLSGAALLGWQSVRYGRKAQAAER